jgi:hypothetical protein
MAKFIVLSSDFVDEFSTATSSKPPNPMRIQLVHQDHVIPPPNGILPPNCIILGRSAQCQIQGVYWPRRLLTFQGHPEFDRHICRETTEAFLVEDLKMDSGLRKKSLQAIDQDDDDKPFGVFSYNHLLFSVKLHHAQLRRLTYVCFRFNVIKIEHNVTFIYF